MKKYLLPQNANSYKANMHCHSTLSDGAQTPEELKEAYKAEGYSVLAITDHDSMKNSFVTPNDPVQVLVGVELSSQLEDGKQVHILCYLPRNPRDLDDYCEDLHQRRIGAGEIMMERVKKLYPIVTEERIAQYTVASGEKHKQDFMNVLIDFGYTNELYGDLYKELFDRKKGTCIQIYEYEPTLKMVKQAKEWGGVVVIAHAGESKVIPLVNELAAAGLIDGAEVYHPRNSEEDSKALAEICTRYNLIQTGGSDYHGRNNSRRVLPGSCTTTKENLERIYELADKRR